MSVGKGMTNINDNLELTTVKHRTFLMGIPVIMACEYTREKVSRLADAILTSGHFMSCLEENPISKISALAYVDNKVDNLEALIMKIEAAAFNVSSKTIVKMLERMNCDTITFDNEIDVHGQSIMSIQFHYDLK